MKRMPKRVDPRSLNLWDRCRYESLKACLKKTGGKLQPAAKLIGLSTFTARKHARELGLWPWKKEEPNGKTKAIHK